LSFGAKADKPNEKNKNERPIHLAAINGRLKIMKLLLKHGASINVEFETTTGPRR
jgi:ankyrin repeat protein